MSEPKPLLLFDGDCRFCRHSVSRWKRITGPRVDFEAWQTAAARFPEIPVDDFERAVQLIEPDGRRSSGAEAVFRSLSYNRFWRWPIWLYRRIPGVATISESAYAWTARHRPQASQLTQWLSGNPDGPSEYWGVRTLFLRGLALTYALAFGSLYPQIPGLIGLSGILPAERLMEKAGLVLGGPSWRLPTLAWYRADEAFLQFLCAAGVIIAMVAFQQIWPRLCLLLLWSLYLSLVAVGGDFLSFQWDALLLQTGLFAIFFAPAGILPARRRWEIPSRSGLWLLRALLFSLMLESGIVKLASGDMSWRNLSALRVYYETQPIPNPLSWYMHQLPAGAQALSAVFVFFTELIVPWFIFAGRRWRRYAFNFFVLLQGIIMLSGNYAFFNGLTIVLCLTLLDDHLLPRRLQERPAGDAHVHRGFGRHVRLTFVALFFGLTAIQLGRIFGIPWPRPVNALSAAIEPFRSINTYGLFAVMTTSRPEIVIEGTRDGQTWLPYEFKYKVQALNRRPPQVAPHQPRLDWQMWFAALGSYRDNPWFLSLCQKLLEGSPAVKDLLASDPFGEAPPRAIRARLYEYHFASPSIRHQTGQWWTRTETGNYCPPLALKAGWDKTPS